MPSKIRALHFALRAWLLVILLQLGVSHGHAQTNASTNIVAFTFTDMEASDMFQIYQQLSGLEVVISPGAMSASKRTVTVSVSGNTPMTNAEVCQLLEKALREQTALIITKTDDKKATVTFDAALPIKPVVAPPPPAKVTRTNTPPSSPPSLLPPPPADKKQ